jgi:hypothetical protein
MTEETKSPGARRAEILAAEMRCAAITKNGAAIGHAYVETAKKLLAENSEMSSVEKQAHHGALIHAIEMLRARTNQDCSNVLGALARILGVMPRVGTA